MGTSNSAAEFVGKINRAAKAFEKQRKETLLDIRDDFEDAATKAVASDLGGVGMSNWRRGNEIALKTQSRLQGVESVEFTPSGKSRGPWRVAEQGRKGGGSFDLVLVGRARKNGTRRGKSRGRNQGATDGKNTWSDAVGVAAPKLPKKMRSGFVKAAQQVFK